MPNWCYNTISLNSEGTKEQLDFINKLKSNLKDEKITRPLCDLILPMPKEFEGTKSPEDFNEVLIEDEDLIAILKEQPKSFGDFGDVSYEGNTYRTYKSGDNEGKWFRKDRTPEAQELLDKFGATNWYDWSNLNLGTKWGDCDTEIDEDSINYSTAWGPLNEDVINKIAEIFPNLHLFFEEEQGWGGEFTYEDGELSHLSEWDIPDFDEVEEGDDAYEALSDDYKELFDNRKESIYHSSENQGNPDNPFVAGFYYDYPSQDEAFETLEELLDAHKVEIDKFSIKIDDLNENLNEIKDFIKKNEKPARNPYSLVSDLLGESDEFKRFNSYHFISRIENSLREEGFKLKEISNPLPF